MEDVELGRNAYLLEAAPPPETAVAASNVLGEFLRSAEKKAALSRKERLRIVEQAIVLLEKNYVHLPMKRAVHGIDPIQQLKRFQFFLAEAPKHCLGNSIQFHRRMLQIFGSMRDLHTVYTLPTPYKECTAYLPFLIEQCFDERGVERFIVTRTAPSKSEITNQVAGEPSFEPGVEVLHWNGVPIRRAIEINGEIQAGSNADALFARGLDNLTIRPLSSSLPPDEDWVDVEYRTESGSVAMHRAYWLVDNATDARITSALSKSSSEQRFSVDVRRRRICAVRKKLYASRTPSHVWSIGDSLYALTKQVDGRDVAYIRVFNFEVDNQRRFLERVVRLVTKPTFPQAGLILDVRGNPGGNIRAAESLLQLFTPKRIEPASFEFINTPLNYTICKTAPKDWNLERWVPSMRDAALTGAAYSAGFPLTLDDQCNGVGQVYYGPVVLITDALSYSATDMFAAGFQDNRVGVVLGTSDNTGAGGANVWSLDDLLRALGGNPESPYKKLPKGVEMRVAMRRSSRVGAHAGVLLEEFGVEPDERHRTTRADILEQNGDLIAAAAAIIQDRPMWRLSVQHMRRTHSPGVVVSAESRIPSSSGHRRGGKAIRPGSRPHHSPIARVEVIVQGRLKESIDAHEGNVRTTPVAIERNGRQAASVEVHALDGTGTLVASRRIML